MTTACHLSGAGYVSVATQTNQRPHDLHVINLIDVVMDISDHNAGVIIFDIHVCTIYNATLFNLHLKQQALSRVYYPY